MKSDLKSRIMQLDGLMKWDYLKKNSRNLDKKLEIFQDGEAQRYSKKAVSLNRMAAKQN